MILEVNKFCHDYAIEVILIEFIMFRVQKRRKVSEEPARNPTDCLAKTSDSSKNEGRLSFLIDLVIVCEVYVLYCCSGPLVMMRSNSGAYFLCYFLRILKLIFPFWKVLFPGEKINSSSCISMWEEREENRRLSCSVLLHNNYWTTNCMQIGKYISP